MAIYLIVADRYKGCVTINAEWFRQDCFMDESLTDQRIDGLIAELVTAGLVSREERDGHPSLRILKFADNLDVDAPEGAA